MRVGSWLVAAAIFLTPLTASANDPAAGREQLKLGYTLAQAGKYDEALPHLLESLRLDPKAITLINLADCEERLGHFADAMGHWVDARSRAQAESIKAIEEEATVRAKDLEPRLARLTITLAAGTPNDAVVERDGVALGAPSLGIPLPVDPGPHALVVKAAGHASTIEHLTVTEGQAKQIELHAGAEQAAPPTVEPTKGEPAPKAEGRTSPLVFIGFGVAAAGVAAGAITGVMALGKGSDAETACPNLRCNQTGLDDVDSGRTLGTVSTIAFIVAGVGAAVGIYGLVAKPSKRVAISPFGVGGAF